VKPRWGRVAPLELGCGTGTNSVWLARQGFEVTGVDRAPLAVQQAQRRAQAAEVKVNFVLADVLDLPELGGPFGFFFDRGCYYAVRRSAAEQYAAAVARGGTGGTGKRCDFRVPVPCRQCLLEAELAGCSMVRRTAKVRRWIVTGLATMRNALRRVTLRRTFMEAAACKLRFKGALARRQWHPGGRGLILAGNAREAQQPGPPVVTEEEIRDELGSAFQILDLVEFCFDEAPGVPARFLAWSCLVEKR